jgi:peptidoglycan/LPS O-acetylase OafA/YrhL
MQRSEKDFYPELEALRGVAALAVSICHVWMAGAAHSRPFAALSFADWQQYVLTSLTSSEGAVAIFFVLSGFVLSEGLRGKPLLTAEVYAQFVVRRLFRIMPALIVAVLIAQAIRHSYFGASETWADIVKTALLLTTDFRIDPPLWSLRVEMAASLVFPLMVFGNRLLAPVVQGFILVGLLCLPRLRWSQDLVIVFLFCFQLGLMVRILGPLICRMPSWLAGALLGAALLAVMVPTNLSLKGHLSMHGHIAIEGMGAFYVVAYVWARRSAALTRVLCSRPLRFLGRISYSLYLLNYPIAAAVLSHMGIADGPFSLPLALAAAAITLAINIALAAPLHRFVEVPSMRAGRRLQSSIAGTWPRPSPKPPAEQAA